MFKKTAVTKTTWNSRAGTSTAFQLDTKKIGRRVVAHVWADDPSVVELRAITGTFWRPAKPSDVGVEHASRTCYFRSEDQVREMATQMASEVWG